MRVALTQSEGRLEGLEHALQERGFDVLRVPLIQTEPLLTPAVREAARALIGLPWLLFTSPAGVGAWEALGLSLDNSSLNGSRLGAVGDKTARALTACGGEVSLVGEPQNAAGLAEVFLESGGEGPVGLPQGNRALPTLRDTLVRHGFETYPVVIYQTMGLEWCGSNGVDTSDIDVVVLSSPSAVAGLPDEVGARARFVTLGPSTADAVAARGWRAECAERPDAAVVLEVIERLVNV